MFSVRSLISAAGTASRMIGTYVNYPTNRASRTPLSSVLRCALSTTPDSDTSGSHSTKKKIKKETTKLKVGVNTINIPPDIPSVILSSSLSADLGTTASAKSSVTQSESLKPMDRDERMAYLEETIKNKDADLRGISTKIDSLVDEQLAIRRIPEASRDNALLDSIEKVIADMKVREKRFATEIVELKAELSALKHPKELAGAPVPPQGM